MKKNIVKKNIVKKNIKNVGNSNLLKNIGGNLIFQILAFALSFIYVPISRKYLGDVKYGVWATITSIVSWINLSDVGIGYGLKNRLTEAVTNNKQDEAKKLMSTAYFLMFAICIFVLIVYVCLANVFNLSDIFNISIQGENINFVLTITVIFMCVNLWLGLVNQIYYANQKPALITLFNLIDQLLNIIFIMIIVKLKSASLVIYALILGICTLSARIMSSLYSFYKYPHLRPNIRFFEKKYIGLITSLGLVLFVGQISGMILNSTDNILISKLFGARHVTPYSMAYKIFQIFIMIHGAIIMPMWSAFTLHKEKEDFAWIRNALKKMNQMTSVIGIGAIVAVFVIPSFSDIWLQHHLEYDLSMLIVMASYVIIYMYGSNYASLLCGVGKVRIYASMSIVSAILNILLSVFFSIKCNMGLTGIIAGTLVGIIPTMAIQMCETYRWLKSVEKRE